MLTDSLVNLKKQANRDLEGDSSLRRPGSRMAFTEMTQVIFQFCDTSIQTHVSR